MLSLSMDYTLVLVMVMAVFSDAFVAPRTAFVHSNSRSSLTQSSSCSSSSSVCGRHQIRMDYIDDRKSSSDNVEGSSSNNNGEDDASTLLSQVLGSSSSSSSENKELMLLLEAFGQHGMPWKSSIDTSYKHPCLFYMPFWKWQKDFMLKHLTNLRPLQVMSKDGTQDLSYIDNTSRQPKQVARMSTMQFTSDEYRKVRMTVYDAGNQTQVFTSLWYPQANTETPLPVLGIDLLQFNLNRYLCVIDFQPLHKDEVDDDSKINKYMEQLHEIRQAYPSLQEKMTARFYDETEFFSKQMLLGRFPFVIDNDKKKTNENNNNNIHNPNNVHPHELIYEKELMPAFQQYIQTHVQMVKDMINNNDSTNNNVQYTLKRQQDYDNYSSERDPAHGMFVKQFGNDFANDYVYDILFSLSTNKPQTAQ